MQQKNNAASLKWIWKISGTAKRWPAFQTLVRISQSGIAILYAYALGNVVDAALDFCDRQIHFRSPNQQ